METKSIIIKANPIETYKSAILAAKEDNFSRDKAKIFARDLVIEQCPNLKAQFGDKEASAFWAQTGELIKAIYPREKRRNRNKTEKPKEEVANETDANDGEVTFMDKMRTCADTGFIPLEEHLAPFIGSFKARQLSSYKNFLVQEGYTFEKNEHGFITTKRPQPKPAKKPDMPKELQEALKVLAGIMAKYK
jgi:hypothetical protein